jgi:hypothetical protein
MNCTSFREAVHEMDRDGLLDASAYDAAVSHAQACTRCARLLYQVRRLDTSLKALSRADERRETPYRTQAELLRAFRAQTPLRMEAGRTLRWLSAAAAILIVVGGGFLGWRHIRLLAPASKPVHTSTFTRPSPQADASSRGAGEVVQPDSARPAVTQPRASGPQTKMAAERTLRTVRPAASDLEDLADFIPLPYADDDLPVGAAELVRVRLPESALAILGFPVRYESADQAITADIVIGEDGVARAIRFVSGPVPLELAELRNSTLESKGEKP